MKFPSSSLKASGGAILCWIFENPQAGVARDLFWSFTVEFEPLHYCDDEWECSMCCEWLRWPIRDWRTLEGQQFESDTLSESRAPEASFYMCSHDPARSVRLSVGERRGASFRVSLSMVVDFQGYAGGDENPEMKVEAESDLPFTGLIMMRDGLFPKPTTEAEADTIARNFMDIELLELPQLNRTRWEFRPLTETEL